MHARLDALALLAQAEEGSGSIFGDGGSGVVFLALVVLGALFFVMRLTTRRTTRVETPTMRERRPRPGDDKPNIHGSAHPELEKLYVDLHDFSREIEARIDTKIAYLKGLIDEAERVGARIEGVLRGGGGSGGSVARQEPEPVPTMTDGADAGEGHPDDADSGDPVEPLSEDKLDPESVLDGDEKEQLSASPNVETSADETEEPASELGQTVDVRVGSEPVATDQVVELYRKGQSAGEIAAQLGVPRGEVELIINLAESSSEKA